MRKVLVSLLTAAAIVAPSVHVSGAPSSSAEYSLSLTLRDAAGDVMLSDGSGTYAGRDTISSITDNDDPAVSDSAQLQPWRKREFWIQHPLIEDGSRTECSFAWATFKSSTTPDWFSAGGGLGELVFRCSPTDTDHTWVVRYPAGVSECVEVTRTDAATWTFSAPAYSVDLLTGEPTGCPALLRKVITSKGKSTTLSEHTDISAPFAALTTMQP